MASEWLHEARAMSGQKALQLSTGLQWYSSLMPRIKKALGLWEWILKGLQQSYLHSLFTQGNWDVKLFSHRKWQSYFCSLHHTPFFPHLEPCAVDSLASPAEGGMQQTPCVPLFMSWLRSWKALPTPPVAPMELNSISTWWNGNTTVPTSLH